MRFRDTGVLAADQCSRSESTWALERGGARPVYVCVYVCMFVCVCVCVFVCVYVCS